MEKNLVIQNVNVPKIFYGTAWKEEKTFDLTSLALENGFTGIDTANQRKHYFEQAVGEAVCGFLGKDSANKKIFLQSKFTYRRGQDHRLPYDEHATLKNQVVQSFNNTLEHFKVSCLDSFLLHGPYDYYGNLTKEDFEVWDALEELVSEKKVKFTGVSNVRFGHLKDLFERSRIKPTFVQNRCYANTKWDFEVRKFCLDQGIVYQGFSLLTANKKELESDQIKNIATKYSKTIPQIIFNFAMEKNMIIVTGTNSPEHMKQDLDIFDFKLDPSDLDCIESIGI